MKRPPKTPQRNLLRQRLNDRFECIQKSFVKHVIGGRVNGGQPRTFLKWVARHVINSDNKTMRSGGVAVLKLILKAAAEDSGTSWKDLNQRKAKRTWTSIRAETAVNRETSDGN